MRSINTIIKTSGNLKRNNPDEREIILVFRAICDCSLPKFTKQDLYLFEGILKDLFPGEEFYEKDYEDLDSYIDLYIKKYNLVWKAEFKEKII